MTNDVSLKSPLFEIVTTTTGAVSIRNTLLNEIMHNPVGPWKEAQALYVVQSKLKQKLSENLSEELVLFDVGLGAAANALAALHCVHEISLEKRRPFHMISFEKDLDLIHFALENHGSFYHFEGYTEAIEELLKNGRWESEKIVWELRSGSFLDLIDSVETLAHIVFFDPYSPMVNKEMWTTLCFQKLFQKCVPRENGGALLLTYSQATRIRVALIAAGFSVGFGCATGLKKHTTQGATDQELLAEPLDQRWFERWQRSHDRYPFDCEDEVTRRWVDQQVEAAFLKAPELETKIKEC